MSRYVLSEFPPDFNPEAGMSDADVAASAAELHRLIGTKDAYYLALQIKRQLAHEFGRRQGWVIAPDGYGAQHLFGKRPQYHNRDIPPHQDHAIGYRKGRAPMAIVSQPYPSGNYIEDMRAWAASRGLVFTVPVYPSWWYPGWTTLCVFTREPLQ
jgi:hypothetical protein